MREVYSVFAIGCTCISEERFMPTKEFFLLKWKRKHVERKLGIVQCRPQA